jgi:hypothetical protein
MYKSKLNSSFGRTPLMFKIIPAIIIIVIIGSIYLTIKNQSKLDIVQDCKVMDLQQQQLINGSGNNMKTEIRYLVITDKETFVCESSLLNGKYNNSDIFWRLKKDSIYTFRVAGVGKSILYNYRNILEVVR